MLAMFGVGPIEVLNLLGIIALVIYSVSKSRGE
jgi:hypothetical protein